MTDLKKRWAVIFHSTTAGVPNRLVDRFASQAEASAEASRLNRATGFGGHYGAHYVDRLGYEFRKELGLAHARKKRPTPAQHAKIGREVDAILYAPGKHCLLSGSLCPNCLRYRYAHNLGNKTASELGLTEKQYREQIAIAEQIAQELAAEDTARKKRGHKAHSTINRDAELYPTTEARRHVQTIQHREDFPEILSVSMRADGTNYNVKVPDPKNKLGYDLVDVLIHDNGMRSIKSASRSRTTPDRASKIVARYLAATQGASGSAHSTIATRDYEYVVYPEATHRHAERAVNVPMRRVGGAVRPYDLTDAKRVAKEMGAPAAVYSVSKGRFVGYVHSNGRYVPFR